MVVVPGLVRFAVAPPKPAGPRPEPFSAQLALAQIHSRLAPLTREAEGYEIDQANAHGFRELPAERGFAGYGLARALRLLLDVLEGASALHDTLAPNGQPFVHGELVPALIRVDGSGAARLVPLAPWHWSVPGTLASPGRMAHLAPERLLGDVLDQRADVFSAGVLLWEALAGGRLFEFDSSDQIITRLMGGRVALPAIPPELSWAAPLKAVAMCALSVDPGQRYASVSDFAEAIEAVAAEHLASHAEVAAFLSVRDPHGRPSVLSQPIDVPTHNSSLSALVAPVTRSEAVPRASVAPPHGHSLASAGRRKRQLWAGAAAVSLLVAIGVGFAARGAVPQQQASGVLSEVPQQSELPAPRATELPGPGPSAAPPIATSDAALAVPAASAVVAAPSPASDSATGKAKASKPAKGPKATAAKSKPAIKYLPHRDKDAEKYGI